MTMQFRTIVVSVEDPKLPHELREALKLVEPGGRIHVLHVPAPDAAAPLNVEQQTARAGLEAIATPYPEKAQLALHVRPGDRAEESLRLTVEAEADLLVLGQWQPDTQNVVPRVMSWAACSVLVLSPNREGSHTQGFVPLFPQCSACATIRRRKPNRWYCDEHRAPEAHLFEPLEQS